MRQARMYLGILAEGRTGPHLLPLASIKKIMEKSGENVNMISDEALIMFSKACEMLIEELIIDEKVMDGGDAKKRRTLYKEDVVSTVIATDIFDFLVNLVSDSTCIAPIDFTATVEREKLRVLSSARFSPPTH